MSECFNLFAHSLYDMLDLELVPHSESDGVGSVVGTVFLLLIGVILHIHRVCNVAEAACRLAKGVFGQLLNHKDISTVRIRICGTFYVYVRFALRRLILFYVKIYPDIHQSSLKSTPPIMTGSPMFVLRNFKNFQLLCILRAAVLSMACLFTFLCGQVGQPFTAADAAAITGNYLKFIFNSLFSIGVNIITSSYSKQSVNRRLYNGKTQQTMLRIP